MFNCPEVLALKTFECTNSSMRCQAWKYMKLLVITNRHLEVSSTNIDNHACLEIKQMLKSRTLNG